jgi:predicted aspartyl protease
VTLIGPTGSATKGALLDTGADDTVFPEDVAQAIGLDLSGAPVGTASGVGMQGQPLRYAQVLLRIASNYERREWQAWVGFTAVKLRQPLLGFAGFLQFFTATFSGDREEVELAVNGLYPGT